MKKITTDSSRLLPNKFGRWFKKLYALAILYLAIAMFLDATAAQIRFLGVAFALLVPYFLWSSRAKYSESKIIPILDFVFSIGLILAVAIHFINLLSNLVTFFILSMTFFLPFYFAVIFVFIFFASAPLIFIKKAYRSVKNGNWLIEGKKIWVLILFAAILASLIMHMIEPTLNMRKIEKYRQQFQAEQHRPMKIGVGNHVFLGYSLTGDDYLEKEDFAFPYLDWLLEETRENRLDFLRIGVSYDAWVLGNKKEQALSDKYIEKIRKSGVPLFLTDTQHQEYLLGKNMITFDEHTALQLERTEFFVKRYKPEYYSIVTEVEGYNLLNIKEELDVDKWIIQTEKLADLVKSISPETKTVAYIDLGEGEKSFDYFKKALRIKSLDVIGLDFYGFGIMKKARKLLDEVDPHDYGKELWIAETYYGMSFPCAPKSKESLDAAWLKMSYEFAQHYKADAYIPWPFEHLLTYKCAFLGEKVDFSDRTEVMDAFIWIIKDAKGAKN